MDTSSVLLLPLAEEYLEAAQQCGSPPRYQKLIRAALKCLWAVVNSKHMPSNVRITARLILAKVVLQEVGDRELVESVCDKGVQDASEAQMYVEKLEFSLILASISPNVSFECIDEARLLGDERLIYSLQLLKIRRLWHSTNSKEIKQLALLLKELEQDQLIAVSYLAYLIESWYHLGYGNVKQAYTCLNEIQDLSFCPPQYSTMKMLASVQIALLLGNSSEIERQLQQLKFIDPTAFNPDGSVYITTFGGYTIELSWLTRNELTATVQLLTGVCTAYSDPTQSVRQLNQLIKSIEKMETFGYSNQRNTQRVRLEHIRSLAVSFIIQVLFSTSRWDEALPLVNQVEDSRTAAYLRGCAAQAKGQRKMAQDCYAIVRSDNKRDELHILSTLNLLLICQMYSETTGPPHQASVLHAELDKLCNEDTSSELIKYAYDILKCAYGKGIPQLNQHIKSQQLKCIASTLRIPFCTPEVYSTNKNSQLEQEFANAGQNGKAIKSLIWMRVAALLRRERYETLAAAAKDSSAYNEAIAKGRYYDDKIIDNNTLVSNIRDQIG